MKVSAGGLDRQLVLDLRAVAVTLDLVGVDVLADRGEVDGVGWRAAGAGDARLGVDDDVLDRVAQRRQREDRRGRVAARAGDEVGAGDLLAVQLGQPVDRPRQQLRRRVRLVPLLVAGAVEPEVGGQVDDLQAAVQHVLHDRRGGLVRVGDDRPRRPCAATSSASYSSSSSGAR